MPQSKKEQEFEKKQIRIIYNAMSEKNQSLAEIYYGRFKKGLRTIGKAGLTAEQIELGEDKLPIPGVESLLLWEDVEQDDDEPQIEIVDFDEFDDDDDF